MGRSKRRNGRGTLGILLLAIACSVVTTVLLLQLIVNDNTSAVTPRVMVQQNIWVSESSTFHQRTNDRKRIESWSLRKSISHNERKAAKQQVRQGPSPSETNENDNSTASVPKRQLVICTRVRNEAPYLKEWIEYHRMIGFEAFLILNNDSTDDTQCLLDEYASRGIVYRIPQEVDASGYNLTENVDNVFDVCTKYLKSHPQHFNTSTTWMSTHDTDEFLWFNKTESVPTFSDAIDKLRTFGTKWTGIESLKIPRLIVGSSEEEHYSSGLVMDRFTHRFNIEQCPRWKNLSNFVRGRNARGHHQKFHRRLFEQEHPVSYCSDPQRKGSFDYFKGMSLVENLAERCFEWEGTSVPCSNTHRHTLITVPKTVRDQEDDFQPASSIQSRARDRRFLAEFKVGTEIVIMHYMTKSRQEFYERVCTSVWRDKYSQCPTCSPETFFNLTMSYANNDQDDRMAPFSVELKPILQSSTIGEGCNTNHPRRSLDSYKECIEHRPGTQ